MSIKPSCRIYTGYVVASQGPDEGPQDQIKYKVFGYNVADPSQTFDGQTFLKPHRPILGVDVKKAADGTPVIIMVTPTEIRVFVLAEVYNTDEHCQGGGGGAGGDTPG